MRAHNSAPFISSAPCRNPTAACHARSVAHCAQLCNLLLQPGALAAGGCGRGALCRAPCIHIWCIWRQVHWLRVILDEGHKVGGAALTNKLAMAANLRAERRWVPSPPCPCWSVILSTGSVLSRITSLQGSF